jgi:hypothetical protein
MICETHHCYVVYFHGKMRRRYVHCVYRPCPNQQNFSQSVSVSVGTYNRKDAGFENSGSTEGRAWGGLVPRSRAGAAGSSYAAVALSAEAPSATGSRLASQATAKLFAQAQVKKIYPEHEKPRTKRLTPVVLGFSCSLRGTCPLPFHQSAPGPKCYYDTLVALVSGQRWRQYNWMTWSQK